MNVEVFKTNVVDRDKADWLIGQIQKRFVNYSASFDLDDCDRILVVKCTSGVVYSYHIIDLLKSLEYHAEVLPDK